MAHALASSALVRVAPAVAASRASRAAPRRGVVIVAREKGARARAFDPEFENERPSRREARVPPHTHELRVTSTNDLVDAVIRRALRPAELDSLDENRRGAFGDADEHPGTRHADDTELLEALLGRAGEITACEVSDVLHAVSRSARFAKLPSVPRGRLLDAFAELDGPFHAMQRMYLDESAPMAWMRPRREETDPPPWTGAPASRRPGKRKTPYGYSPRDVARIAYALASFPRATDQSAETNRRSLAKAAAHFAARFSRDEWTREHAEEGDLATLAWSFAEIPGALGDDALTRKACRRAMRELSHPVRRHAAAFSAEEIVVVACAYERAYDDCALGGPEKSGAADGRATANHALQALAPQALRRASEFSAEQLGYVSDACARFGVHPKGEGMWDWNAVVRKRRKEESDAAISRAEKNVDA